VISSLKQYSNACIALKVKMLEATKTQWWNLTAAVQQNNVMKNNRIYSF